MGKWCFVGFGVGKWCFGDFWCGSTLESLPSLSRGLCGGTVVWVSGDSWVLVWVFSLVVFLAVTWCGLGMVRFRSTMVGFLWEFLVVDSHKAIKRRIFFFRVEAHEFGGFLKRMFWFWIRILSLEALEGLGCLSYSVCGSAVVWVRGG